MTPLWLAMWSFDDFDVSPRLLYQIHLLSRISYCRSCSPSCWVMQYKLPSHQSQCRLSGFHFHGETLSIVLWVQMFQHLYLQRIGSWWELSGNSLRPLPSALECFWRLIVLIPCWIVSLLFRVFWHKFISYLSPDSNWYKWWLLYCTW